MTLQICICGGGNASHVMIGQLGLAANVRVHVFAPYGDEAEKLQAGSDAGGVTVTQHRDGSKVIGKAAKISKDPAEVIPGSKVIFIPLPCFAHRPTLEAIKPHLDKSAMIGTLPGGGGFQWVAKEVLGDRMKDYVIFGTNLLPYNCRITEFGKAVTLFGEKLQLGLATVPRTAVEETVKTCSEVVASLKLSFYTLPSFLCVTLWSPNPIIHPARMYGMFKDWDGKPTRNPLFYEEMDDFSADMIAAVDAETQAVRHALEKALGYELPVPPFFESFKKGYGSDIVDPSTLRTAMATNKGYKGIYTAMKKVDGGYEPDFQGRYFTEDIPEGLCLTKGLAEIVGVQTPTIDMLITWAQGKMGKEFLVDGKLCGKDLSDTTAPQRFGLTKPSDLDQ